MEKKEAAVSLRNVTKTFGPIVANKKVSMDIYRGEILSLLGENGSGKTTLMNMLSGIYYPDEGQILENIVFNELIYNGYSVNVGVFDSIEKNQEGKSVRKTNEIDFYASKGLRAYYIQVTTDISNVETRARETRPYMILNDQIQKIIVTNHPIHESRDENGFTVIGITDFLLRFIK